MMPVEGEWRGFPLSLSVTVPWGTDDQRVRAALPKYIAQFIERREKHGEVFDGFIGVTRGGEKLLDPVKGERVEYVVRLRFKAIARQRKIELPDETITYLINNHPHKYNERMVS